jgi:protein-S-isoprenylcysteine O-methyltransferase Ste14
VHFDVFHFDVFQWIDGLWITFIVIWLLGAMRVKRATRRISGRSRVLQILLAIAGAILLFDPSLGIGFLASRFLPENATVAYLGLAMTAGGLAFAVWARFILGRNWSGQITVKEGHELIRRGPYALVRHPIYSGILLGLLGTAFCVDEVRGLIGFGLFLAGWWLKARVEEALMIEQFGDQYRRYQREVKALIPFVV